MIDWSKIDLEEVKERWTKNKREIEEKKEKKRVNYKWKKVEKMRVQEERKTKKEWRKQELGKRRREENRKRAIEDRRCFVYVEYSGIWLIIVKTEEKKDQHRCS